MPTEPALVRLSPQAQLDRAQTGTDGHNQALRLRSYETTSTTQSKSPKLKPNKRHTFQDNLPSPTEPQRKEQYHILQRPGPL
ncbi:hypothetical protein BDP55DRAFT_680686 [Colletotrichum godetiae]|uniref:Uncharacterized protein n=1 Tax=Colletotrichum godetiae TaxID=1209918 RepID=A0AAJ0ACE5_9PEZI|nr:uncharacterized protein BDP55DRAFT_680686 [Colletotrichum godetiae]KAK1659047.1 hypothetical protein BDP55DRAFT_680686 [Colletotrichum godetiae]